jgi:Zn-dependent protease with chaperone function
MKPMKILFSALFVFLSFLICGQPTYTLPQVIPPAYTINKPALRDSIIARYKTTEEWSQITDYAGKFAYSKSNELGNGNVFYNFGDFEAYLNHVIQRLLANSGIAEAGRFKAYLKNDNSFNAYSMLDGTILVCLGMISRCQSEDALACILAHEIAHLRYNDVLANWKRDQVIDWRKLTQKEIDKLNINRRYSIEQELRADSFGYSLARRAGYDIRHSYSNLNMMHRSETRQLLYNSAIEGKDMEKEIRFVSAEELGKYPDVSAGKAGKASRKSNAYDEPLILSTHPGVIDRVRLLNRILAESHDSIKLNADTAFRRMQETAQRQMFMEYLEDHDYISCMEAAFVLHIQDTANQEYIYYILESMRRFLAWDAVLPYMGFLNINLNKVLDKKKSILHKPLYLVPDSTLFKRLQGIKYFDLNYEFENYLEAFVYFYEKANTRQNIELELTAGLFLKKYKLGNGDSLLRHYASSPAARYREYARAVLNGELYSSMAACSRNIVFCSNISEYEGRRKRYVLNNENSDSLTSEFAKRVNDFDKWPAGSEIYFVRDKGLDDLPFLYENLLIKDAMYYMVDHPLRTEFDPIELTEDDFIPLTKRIYERENNYYYSYLYELEPATWTWLKQNNIKSLSFFYSSKVHDEKRKRLNTISGVTSLLIPAAILIRASSGSWTERSRLSYITMTTDAPVRPLILELASPHDVYSIDDYLNALYFSIKSR